MNRLNSEGHDESQYLPKDTPPVNPFRANHGNVVWEGKAIKNITWMPDIMILEELINGDHFHTCQTFYRSVLSTRAALGISDIRHFISTNGLSSYQPTSKDPFHAVMRDLRPWIGNLCLWVVCDDYNHGNRPLARKLKTDIQSALEEVQKLIDSLQKSVEQILNPDIMPIVALGEVSLKRGS